MFIALGVIATASTLVALGLKDPGYGQWDTEQLRRAVHDKHGDHDGLDEDAVALGFWEICRRLLLIPTVRRLLAGFAVIGVLAAPLSVFLAFFLESRWQLEADQRAIFLAYQAAVSVVALVVYGGRGERMFREDPPQILRTTGVALAVAIAPSGSVGWSRASGRWWWPSGSPQPRSASSVRP